MKEKKPEVPTAILIVFEGSYMGDIDIDGFEVATQKDWDEHLEVVEKMFKDAGKDASFEKFFGTHESIAFDSFESYKKHFKIIPLTSTVEAFFKKNFRTGFGHFLTLEEFDVKQNEKQEKEIQELIDKKKRIIPANFFDALRFNNKW